MIRYANYFFLLLLLPLVQLVTGCKDGGTGVEETIVPVITSVEPDSGRFGTTVFISGEHFGATPAENQVTFNGVEAMITRADQTLLVAEVPKGAGKGPVQVTVNGDTGTGPAFNYILTVAVTTWAGGSPGYADGTGTNAQFDSPSGIDLTANGELIVADCNNYRFRKIDPGRTVSTIAGSDTPGQEDGVGEEAQIGCPADLIVSPWDEIFFTHWQTYNIRHLGPSGSVTTFVAGYGDSDGTGYNVGFRNIWGIDMNDNGELLVADPYNYKIRKVNMAREVTTLAGGAQGHRDGALSEAQFNFPLNFAVDNDGDIYVGDRYTIRKISNGQVSTIAGTPEVRGFRDGPADEAQFDTIADLVLGPDGSLYAADLNNNRIRKIDPDGFVTTIAGGEEGFKDGAGEEALFDSPIGLALLDENTLYVSDNINHRIRKITME